MARQGLARLAEVYSTASAAGLTPGTVAGWVSALDRGDPRQITEGVRDAGRRDTHYLAVLGARQSCLTGRKWQVLPGKIRRGQGGAALAQRIADDTSEMLSALPYVWGSDTRPHQLGGINALIWDLQDAVVGPLAWMEKTVEQSEGQAQIKRLDWVHPKLARWQLTQADETFGDLRIITEEQPVWGEPIIRDKWLVHQVRVTSDYPWRSGCAVSVCYGWAFVRFAVERWLRWIDRWSSPTPIAEVPTGTAEEVKDRIYAALGNFGAEGRAVIDELKALHMDGVSGDGDEACERLLSWLERSQSKLLLGHSASADAVSGQLGNTQSAQLVKDDLIAADGLGINATLDRDLIHPWVEWNYGETAPMPHFEIDTRPALDKSEYIKHVSGAQAMGFQASKAHFISMTGLVEAKGPEDVLAPVWPSNPTNGDAAPLNEGGRPVKSPSGESALPEVAEPTEEAGGVQEPITAPELALNGAQVTALLDIIDRVATGQLPRQTAVEIMIAAFSIERSQAEQIMGDVGKGFVQTPEPGTEAAPVAAPEVAA